VTSTIERALKEASAGLPVASVLTMDEIVRRSTARQQFNMLLLSVFGGGALLLAGIGIYALMAYSVQQRTQEIGIRLALGAGSRDVRNMVIGQGMAVALIGVVVGFAAALALTWIINAFLFGVTAQDPLVFAAVPILLSAVALVGVWLPACRTTRVDPINALQVE
jgi:putative ABC transport system permease protein